MTLYNICRKLKSSGHANKLLFQMSYSLNVLLIFANIWSIKAAKKVSQLIFGTSGHEISDFCNSVAPPGGQMRQMMNFVDLRDDDDDDF